MDIKSVQDIERAIAELEPPQLAELYAWLDRHRPITPRVEVSPAVFEQGLGLFGNPEDAALLDEVVQLAYEERRLPRMTTVKPR